MTSSARLVAARQVLAHVPELVFSGSKPQREIARDPSLSSKIGAALRTYDDAVAYPPNQVFVGSRAPYPLSASDRPWWNRGASPPGTSAHGRIFTQAEFVEAMLRVDSAGLLALHDSARMQNGAPSAELVERLGVSGERGGEAVEGVGGRMTIPGQDRPLGEVAAGHPADPALAADVIFENLATKASAALALADLIDARGMDPDEIDFVISCSEEAVGDRYQRGGGNLGKAVAEAVGARRASGFDVKNFCAAPLPALVVASALVASSVASTVAVVAGGSLPKLGMKFQGHLKAGMPVLEDCLGGVATVVSSRGEGPAIRLDAVGRHTVDAGGSNQAIFRQLMIEPLERIGLKATDVGWFGTELHNPELTEPQGSGDVPLRNYRMMAALAAKSQHIAVDEVDDFLARRCSAGFAPTQGHIASSICLLPHVLEAIDAGRIERAQLLAKGSLFLGKMSSLSDGMSVVVE